MDKLIKIQRIVGTSKPIEYLLTFESTKGVETALVLDAVDLIRYLTDNLK